MSGFPNKNVDLSPGQLFRVFSWLNILLEKKKKLHIKISEFGVRVLTSVLAWVQIRYD